MRAKGNYECYDCGHEWNEDWFNVSMECPKCGSNYTRGRQ